MDTESKDLVKSIEPTASPPPIDCALQSASNSKSGKDSESSEKLPQPLECDEEELLLCMNSENEPVAGSCDAKDANAEGKTSEKYFSDIESSDNSQEYEVESKLKKVIEKKIDKLASEEKKIDGTRIVEKCMEPPKTIELELEPVESDEEEFDEHLLGKKSEEIQRKRTIEKDPVLEEALKDLEDISDKEDAQILGENSETTSTDVDAEGTEDKAESLRSEDGEKTKTEENNSGGNSSEDKSIEIEKGDAHVAVDVLPSERSDPKEESCQLEAKDKAAECSSRLEKEKQEGAQLSNVAGVNDDKSDNEAKDISNTTLQETSQVTDKEMEKEGSITRPETEAKILDIAETAPETLNQLSDGDSAKIAKHDGIEQPEESATQSVEKVSVDLTDCPENDSTASLTSVKTLESESDEPIKETEGKCSQGKSENKSDPSVDEGNSKESEGNSQKDTSSCKDFDTAPESVSISDNPKLDAEKEEVVAPDNESVAKEEGTQDMSAKENVDVVKAKSAEKEDNQEGQDAESEKAIKAKEIETQSTPSTDNKEPEKMEKDKEACADLTEKEIAQPPTEHESKKLLVCTEHIPGELIEEGTPISDKDNASSTADNNTDKGQSDDVWNLREKLTTKVSELMKTIDSTSQQGLTSDDDESLLVIDTTHKDDNDNENEDNDMETEVAASDSSSEGSLEIFHHKECSNYDCKHGSKNFYRAPQFALSYYKVSKKQHKPQFVCEDCYDQALHAYEEMCVILKQKQPLYGANFKRQDFVEIIDSSDEEDSVSNAENSKDENTFPKESIEFLENELEGIIRSVMQSVDIQNQLSWTKQVLQQSIDRVREESSYVSDQLQQLQKKADKMHNSLYQCPSIKIRQLTPLDLNSGRSYSPESELTIPAVGDIERPSIQLNETYYAVKNKAIASWVPCKVIEEVEDGTSQTKNLKHFKIKFLKSKYPMLKTLSAKHMAYFDPPKVRLPIGTRVIAYFDASSLSRGKEKMLIPSAFYPGIIAEPLKMSNKFRYLVFYDDGYFQYVSYKDVRLVCHASENVWDDVHHQSRDFIQNYLTQYAVNRPMVQTQKGQCMLVDYNGKWVYARVVDVDCSLVQMMFEGQSRSEWIYRGSTRLGPVYKESNNIAPKTSWNQSRISRRTEPFIRYLNDEDSSSSQPHSLPQQTASKSGEVRSVAKKSVSRADAATNPQPVPVVKHLNNSTIFVDDDNKPKGKVVYYTARKNLPPRDFVPHTCGPSCPFVITHNLQFYSPLAKPLLSGWERQVFRQKSKKFIVYRAPCGKRLRSMEELHRYLRVTNNELNVDNFDFSSETNCLAEYVIESCIVQKKDISNGEEKMPIPCVNYYDNTMPPDCKYSSRRIPTEGVHLNLDPNFLVGCDCDDDCSDKAKCSCWQLTYAGAKYSMPNVPHEMVGYQHKRLYAHVPTGIYECNSRCKCKANCVNRVVQQPLQSKLQVFKTSNRGWGLRCINDVPRGSFICIYAGHLLTEQKANEGGLDAGDEYFAELDYIEVAEQIKEGYESDVAEPDEEEEMYNPDKDDDDDEFIAPGDSYRNKSISTRLSTRRSTKNSSDAEHDSQERQVISFEPNKSQEKPDSVDERPTMRRLFGKDEGTYIMDAKITGNLGRYFNHSCSPNLFVQNVFVDTHDLRFPWVAFFAFSHIRAGTELTWNYNYEVGVVPGKVLYCQCGAPNCRQRLL